MLIPALNFPIDELFSLWTASRSDLPGKILFRGRERRDLLITERDGWLEGIDVVVLDGANGFRSLQGFVLCTEGIGFSGDASQAHSNRKGLYLLIRWLPWWGKVGSSLLNGLPQKTVGDAPRSDLSSWTRTYLRGKFVLFLKKV